MHSGIDPDYLNNPSSWFAEEEQALVTVYPDSWFYSPAFKTRHIPSLDEFHVQPIDGYRLQWPALYDLMQQVGDYLLLRNEQLPPEHLNQPVNFFLLDVNNILKGISQNANIAQVQKQLELLTRYVRTIEKYISPLIGSDRLFMANVREVIDDEIQPLLSHMIESQLLHERLNELQKIIKQVSTERNRILHYALNVNEVNHHAYDFSVSKRGELSHFPTQAAKECGHSNSELMAKSAPTVHLTAGKLKKCPDFELISMNDDVLNHYAKAISDLNELERFQKVITQIMDLLGQAGEVYTIHQFREQMILLLKQIDGFLDESAQHIDAILRANKNAYHQAIDSEQNLSFFKKIFSDEKAKLHTYIKNQDTLAQFPSSSPELDKTNKAFKEHVNQVITHLSQAKMKESSFEAITGQVQELEYLMNSMNQWVHEIKGLPPSPPIQLISTSSTRATTQPTVIPLGIAHNNNMFFTDSPTAVAPTPFCSDEDPLCTPSSYQNNVAYLGLFALIPLAVIFLYLISRWREIH